MSQDLFFSLSPEAIFRLNNDSDCVVAGNVVGSVHVGDTVTVWAKKDDAPGGFEVRDAMVIGIETGPGQTAREAKNQRAALILEGALRYVDESCLLATTTGVPDKAALAASSISELAETWRLYGAFHALVASDTQDALDALASSWCTALMDELRGKILSAEELYCIYSKKTGYPAFFSKTTRLENGEYECTRPAIHLYPPEEKDAVESQLDPSAFEIRRIERGVSGSGIINFLKATFWQDGACAAAISTPELCFSAEDLVGLPVEESGEDTPVKNPQVVRWLLLMGQMGKPQTEDQQIIFQLYWNLLGKELPSARLLQPMKKEIPGGGDASTVETQGMTLSFPTMPGKGKRDAVYLYTDWKRFRTKWGADWQAMVCGMKDATQLFDCALNVTETPEEGCYISQETFLTMAE